MLLLDLSHTSHSRARSGIQRVGRELRRALIAGAEPLTAITHDPHEGVWRPLEAWESSPLDQDLPPTRKRGAAWPMAAKWRGRLRRFARRRPPTAALPPADGLIVPEIFSPTVHRALPPLFEHVRGPRVALFCDAIPLRLPEYTPTGTVARFATYLDDLRQFDGIAAISADSAESLLGYWRWAGWNDHPPVISLPLAADHLASPSGAVAPAAGRRVVSVGSIEGRKNHVTLLAAAESLWAAGMDFELVLLGMAQRESGAAALAEIARLQAAGRPLVHRDSASDAEVAEAYRTSRFTIYPSLMEGFGIPVWESLLHGRPCVCSGSGALGEIAHDGGCVPVDTDDAAAIAAAMRRLLEDDDHWRTLSAAAAARQSPRWSDYAAALTTWMHSLPRRSPGAELS